MEEAKKAAEEGRVAENKMRVRMTEL